MIEMKNFNILEEILGMEWQPIETAPKDGSWIDIWTVWGADKNGKVSVPHRWTDAFWNGEEWESGNFSQTQFEATVTVTHWMPLPDEPAP
tara:strand:- start:58 stop:327 length:270 start_codon:yes stop_codon:yes gene_type:complete